MLLSDSYVGSELFNLWIEYITSNVYGYIISLLLALGMAVYYHT